MAKYTVQCGKCQQEYVVSLLGSHKERERKLAVWAGLCESCAAEKKAAATAQAAETAKKAGLPELTGSPKQVAWAETLRAARIKELGKEDINDLAEDIEKSPAEVEQAIAKIRRTAAAAWWIENRNVSIDDLVLAACE